MRNLLLLAFALGLTTAASAQNNATTNTTGSNNDATVTQTGNNTAFVDQGATGAPANDNNASVAQKGQNMADVLQTGNNNDALILQGIRADGSDAGGTASGNSANVFQSGSNNSGLINGGNDGGVVAQGVNGTADFVQATVTQRGDQGRAQVYQGNNGGSAFGSRGTIDQAGFDNTASVRQGVQGGSSDLSVGTITQSADASTSQAFIRQGADGPSSSSGTVGNQVSQNDRATINQNAGANNLAEINQGVDNRWSEGNVATITQTNPFGRNAPNGGNQTFVNQAATRGTVNAQSRGASNVVTITQGYTDDQSASLGATVTVTGSSNQVTADQDGFNSKVTFVTQGGSNDPLNDGNIAVFEQVGDWNTARVNALAGNDNEITVRQLGDRNLVDNVVGAVSIEGNMNELIVNQTGDYATVRFTIEGNLNDAIVTQTRLGVSGAGDTATVSQLGDSNTATITQN